MNIMTEGPIWKKIVLFALPIMWGNLFQQLYNIVDSLIVGNFLGKDALAAVSSSGSIIFLLLGLRKSGDISWVIRLNPRWINRLVFVFLQKMISILLRQ